MSESKRVSAASTPAFTNLLGENSGSWGDFERDSRFMREECLEKKVRFEGGQPLNVVPVPVLVSQAHYSCETACNIDPVLGVIGFQNWL